MNESEVIFVCPVAAPQGKKMSGRRCHPPLVVKAGTRKTAVKNFPQICLQLRRPLEHVRRFIAIQLGTTVRTPLDGYSAAGPLVIVGRHSAEKIDAVLQEYSHRYINCRVCNNRTLLEYDSPTVREASEVRLRCPVCATGRVAEPIQNGFRD
jgi:translation initiation factor 2 beta subunit (eIF-2beta)/eIF-5